MDDILCFRLVPESIPWLITKRRNDDAYRIIQRAARWNNVEIPNEAQKLKVRNKNLKMYPMAALGAPLARSPPEAQKFLNFMQFFGTFGKMTCWRPLYGWASPFTGILDPPLVSHVQR